MKRILIIAVLFLILPSYALCPIGDGEGICTLPNAGSVSAPLFQNNEIPQNNMGVSNPNNSILQPSNLNNSISQPRNKSGVSIQGSLGCQFGKCDQGLNNPFLQNQ